MNLARPWQRIPTFLVLLLLGCSQNPPDFHTMPKIDAHVHIRYNGPEFVNQAAADNFVLISVVTDHYDILQQEQYIQRQRQMRPDRVAWITSFSMKGWDEPGWQDSTIAHLRRAFQNGAIGVKVWKNVGMVFRDRTGRFVTIDDPKFDPILDFIARSGKTLLGHIGEPKDCWLPLDQMRSESNRRYYRDHPEYHMYLHPDYPSYEELIRSYENMLAKHPNLRYVGAHLASIEWSVAELAKRLDRFPNMAVDLAARIDDIQLLDRDEVRDFFIRYQDRILYGTDLGISEGQDPVAFARRAHERWLQDWTYLATDSLLEIRGIDHPVRGLKLPPKVLRKIYWENAKRWYPGVVD